MYIKEKYTCKKMKCVFFYSGSGDKKGDGGRGYLKLERVVEV
jgi:hypothetical protein